MNWFRSCSALVIIAGFTGCAGMSRHHAVVHSTAAVDPRALDPGPVDPFIAHKTASPSYVMKRYFPALNRQAQAARTATTAARVAAPAEPPSEGEVSSDNPVAEPQPPVVAARRSPGLLTRWFKPRQKAVESALAPTSLPARDDSFDLSSGEIEARDMAEPVVGHGHVARQRLVSRPDIAAMLPVAIEIPIERETSYLVTPLPPVVRHPSAKRRSNLPAGMSLVRAAVSDPSRAVAVAPAPAQTAVSDVPARDDQALQTGGVQVVSEVPAGPEPSTPVVAEAPLSPASLPVPAQEPLVAGALEPLAPAAIQPDATALLPVAVPSPAPSTPVAGVLEPLAEPVMSVVAAEPVVESAQPASQEALIQESAPAPAVEPQIQELPSATPVQEQPIAATVESQLEAPAPPLATSSQVAEALKPLADPSEVEAEPVTEPAITSAFLPESAANPMADLPTPEFPQAYYEQDSQRTSFTATSALKESALAVEPAAADTLAGEAPSQSKAPATLGQRLSRRFQSLWRFGKPQPQVITRLEHCPKCHREHMKSPSDHAASE